MANATPLGDDAMMVPLLKMFPENVALPLVWMPKACVMRAAQEGRDAVGLDGERYSAGRRRDDGAAVEDVSRERRIAISLDAKGVRNAGRPGRSRRRRPRWRTLLRWATTR